MQVLGGVAVLVVTVAVWLEVVCVVAVWLDVVRVDCAVAVRLVVIKVVDEVPEPLVEVAVIDEVLDELVIVEEVVVLVVVLWIHPSGNEMTTHRSDSRSSIALPSQLIDCAVQALWTLLRNLRQLTSHADQASPLLLGMDLG